MRTSAVIVAATLVATAAPSIAFPVPHPVAGADAVVARREVSDLEARSALSSILGALKKPLVKELGKGALTGGAFAGLTGLLSSLSGGDSTQQKRDISDILSQLEQFGLGELSKVGADGLSELESLLGGALGGGSADASASAANSTATDDGSDAAAAASKREIDARSALSSIFGALEKPLVKELGKGALTGGAFAGLTGLLSSLSGGDSTTQQKRELSDDDMASLLVLAAMSDSGSLSTRDVSDLEARSALSSILGALKKPLVKELGKGALTGGAFAGLTGLLGSLTGGDSTTQQKRALDFKDILAQLEQFGKSELGKVGGDGLKAIEGLLGDALSGKLGGAAASAGSASSGSAASGALSGGSSNSTASATGSSNSTSSATGSSSSVSGGKNATSTASSGASSTKNSTTITGSKDSSAASSSGSKDASAASGSDSKDASSTDSTDANSADDSSADDNSADDSTDDSADDSADDSTDDSADDSTDDSADGSDDSDDADLKKRGIASVLEKFFGAGEAELSSVIKNAIAGGAAAGATKGALTGDDNQKRALGSIGKGLIGTGVGLVGSSLGEDLIDELKKLFRREEFSDLAFNDEDLTDDDEFVNIDSLSTEQKRSLLSSIAKLGESEIGNVIKKGAVNGVGSAVGGSLIGEIISKFTGGDQQQKRALGSVGKGLVGTGIGLAASSLGEDLIDELKKLFRREDFSDSVFADAAEDDDEFVNIDSLTTEQKRSLLSSLAKFGESEIGNVIKKGAVNGVGSAVGGSLIGEIISKFTGNDQSQRRSMYGEIDELD